MKCCSRFEFRNRQHFVKCCRMKIKIHNFLQKLVTLDKKKLFHQESQACETPPIWPVDNSFWIQKKTITKTYIVFTKILDTLHYIWVFIGFVQTQYKLNYLGYCCVPTLRHLRILKILIRKKVIAFMTLISINLIKLIFY